MHYLDGLLKGKITETIFEEMFRTSQEFTIIPLGYEHYYPLLAQYQHILEVKQVLDNLRHAPDFALMSRDNTKVFLVEVKYRHIMREDEMLEIAKKTHTKWDPCFIFLATQDQFYFSPCNSIIANNGKMENLRESWIPKDTQIQYKETLRHFIRAETD